MERTINIGDKEVRLSNNIGWTMEYRDQFNRDIIPTIMPMIAGIIDTAVSLISSTGKTEDLELEDLVEMAKSEEFFEALLKLSSFEFVDILNITWSLAKAADEKIPEPKKWIRQFDEFPIDEIGPVIGSMIIQGVVSSKNWQRLQQMIADLNLKELKSKKKNQ